MGDGEERIVSPSTEAPKTAGNVTTALRKRTTPGPHYISQDEEDDVSPPQQWMTRSHTSTIMQEAMLACVDVRTTTATAFERTLEQLPERRVPSEWPSNMANAVIGDNGELLEYRHLIANPKTRPTWSFSYGNEIGRLAQGMPGRNTGTNTIFFIKKSQVPKERAKDVTYGLITTLIRPEKINEPNRTRLVAGGDRVHYPGNAGTPTADLLTVKQRTRDL